MKKIILSTFITISTLAHAGLYLEPHGEYIFMGEVEESGLSSILNYQYDSTGMGYGLKLGWDFSTAFVLGVDVSRGILDWEMTGPEVSKNLIIAAGNKPEEEWKSYTEGVFFLVGLPWDLTFFGTYYFKATIQDQTSNSIYGKSNEFKGTGYGIGFGYKFYEYLSLNFEHRRYEYDEIYIKVSGVTSSLPDSANSIGTHEETQYVLGVSFPFTLFSSDSYSDW